MEFVITPFIIIAIYFAIKGFRKTKKDNDVYIQCVKNMTNGELMNECYNLKKQISHLPKHIWKNSPQGLLLAKNRNKLKIIITEINHRYEN